VAIVRNAMHGKSEKMMKIKVINRIEYGEKDHKNRPHVNGPLSGGKKRGPKTEKRRQRVKTHREQRAKTSRSRGVKHCKAAKVKTKRRKH
jgi:hypothetical protein